MAKRGRLEIIRGILDTINESHNSIKITPLLRKTGLSSSRFREYYNELLAKRLVIESIDKKGGKHVSLSEKGFRFLEKYRVIVDFIDEFEL
ncbi:MAG: winged helix-turn-helix domain-containing protein [Candidatus Nanoarchaeia archaeon]|nr:winged helix-turn-helix domain-containing protein [Candidatus Nanoarchaeia archaeon]